MKLIEKYVIPIYIFIRLTQYQGVRGSEVG
jgi:hypothetical protein